MQLQLPDLKPNGEKSCEYAQLTQVAQGRVAKVTHIEDSWTHLLDNAFVICLHIRVEIWQGVA